MQVVFTPGEPVQIPVESDVTFDPEEEPTVTLSTTGDDATTVEIEVRATVDEDGNLIIDVLVPEDTPESIVVVTITAVDARGVTRTFVYLFPVAGASTTSTTASDVLSRRPTAPVRGAKRWSELPVVPPGRVPAIVGQIQAAIPDDAAVQAILSELAAEPDAVLTVEIDDAELAVVVRPAAPDTGDAAGRSLVTAVLAGVAALGLVSLRVRSRSTETTA